MVIEGLRKIDDPYPYFRGLIAEIGFEPSLVPFRQPLRKRGISSQNFYTLYDLAFLGIVNHSKVPLRMATMAGFALAILSLLVALGYLIAKLLFWNQLLAWHRADPDWILLSDIDPAVLHRHRR